MGHATIDIAVCHNGPFVAVGLVETLRKKRDSKSVGSARSMSRGRGGGGLGFGLGRRSPSSPLNSIPSCNS